MEALEDRTVPSVTIITATPISPAIEGTGYDFGTAGIVRVSRDGPTTYAQIVSLSYSGSATNGTDYNANTYVTIQAGNAYADVLINPIHNNSATGTLGVTLNIVADFFNSYTPGSSGTIDLYDADNPRATVAQQGSNPTEGGNGTFRITRTGSTASSLSVSYTVGGTATSGTDYTTIGASATIPAGYSYVDVTVATLTDNVVEAGGETVIMTITDGGSAYTAYSSNATASLTIVDDPPVISIAATHVVEGESGYVVLTRTGGKLTASLTLSYSVGGTATSGDDYSALSVSVTFAANSDTATVTITAIADHTAEDFETLTITIAPTSSYTLEGGATSTTVSNTIADNGGGFTLDEHVGLISYNIPWSSVDDNQSSQSLALSNFAITFAGETLTSSRSDITFTTSPVAVFAYGTMTGIAFAIDTSGITGYQYSSLSAQNWTLSAVNGTTLNVILAPLPNGLVKLDFASADTDMNYRAKLRFGKGNDNEITTATYDVLTTDTKSDIATKMAAAVNATGEFVATVSSDTILTIKPTEATGNNWATLSYTTLTKFDGEYYPDTDILGPTLKSRQVITISGQIKIPN